MAEVVLPPNGPTFDFDKLEKGTVIKVPELEKLFGCAFQSSQYGLGLMNLVQQIKLFRPDLYPKQSKGSLVIMQDEEAAMYNMHLIGIRLEQVGKTIRDSGRVDKANLSEAGLSKFEAGQQVAAGIALETYAQRARLAQASRVKGLTAGKK